LGNRYGPGVIPEDRGPGVAGSSPSTLTMSLAIPVSSSCPDIGESMYGPEVGDFNIKVKMGECMSRARTVKHYFVCVRCSTLNTVGCWEKGNFESYVVTWCPNS